MSKILSFKFSCVVALFLIAKTAGATKHIVQVGDNFFSPATFNAKVGDTVRWTFVPGSMENHTTTSTTIPAGAATWNQLVNTANPAYEYVITQPGAYNYVCTPHASVGMTGSFTASPTTSVPAVANGTKNLLSPNPARNSVVIAEGFDKSSIHMLDMQGRVVKSWDSYNGNALDISDLPAGLYVVTVQKEKITYKEKLVVIE